MVLLPRIADLLLEELSRRSWNQNVSQFICWAAGIRWNKFSF